MSLYRGAGGASDATDDSTVNAVANYAAQAASSASNAATSATNAAGSASGASTSASAAATSASAAATSATNAATSASSATTSASTASTKASEATASATSASNSAGLASGYLSDSQNARDTAQTYRNQAETFATNAATSASNAATSYNNTLAIYGSTTAVNNAVASATASAATATTQATNAAASAVSAANSASNASNSASAAATSASNAASTASGVNASVSAAAASATQASNSALNAANSATAAATSATAAANSASAAASIVGSGNGTFTTPITTSSTITINSGTANQVQFLNGSKVLSGSTGLTFNGTTLTASDITDSSLTAGRVVYAGTGGNLVNTASLSFDGSNLSAFGGIQSGTTGIAGVFTLVRSSDGAGTAVLESLASTNNIGLRNTAGSILFSANNAEGMRLTSTGLGIGTTSPGHRLHTSINSATIGARFETTGSATESLIDFKDPGTTADFRVRIGSNGDNLRLYAGGATRATIDASGNLGLGVTPSAWATVRALQISNASIYGNGGSDAAFSQNAYFNAGWKYISSAAAAQFQFDNGAHKWFTAPSGTAGNAITFTQAMTLDASGRLGIGTTSPGFALDISLADPRIRQTATTGTNSSLIQLVNTGGTAYIGLDNSSGGLSTAYSLNLYHSGAYPIVFSTSGSERARIDSSGNLLVGTTSVAGQGGLTIQPNISSGSAAVIWNRANTTGTSYPVDFRNGNTTVGFISYTNTATVYSTSSDYRLKEDIQPMTGALAKVAALKPCTYKWKADGSDGEGFIAHELQAVVPQAVTGEKDAVDEEGKPVYQGIDTSFLVATLTAAIQEQQALIQTLTARVAALESNT